MQFRATVGGFEVGSVILDSSGNITSSSYSPYEDPDENIGSFHRGGYRASTFLEDGSETFARVPEGEGDPSYLFGAPERYLAIAQPEAAVLGFPEAARKEFDRANFGSYDVMFYQKTGARKGAYDSEPGEVATGTATLRLANDGLVTILDPQRREILAGNLMPLADAKYLYGSGKLAADCKGLYTFRQIAANSQMEAFVTFIDHVVLFAVFRARLTGQPGANYEYFYGAGLKSGRPVSENSVPN